MNLEKKRAPLSFVTALFFIILSIFLVTGTTFKTLSLLRVKSPVFISAIIQTGPQREALKTVYLAELLDISSDRKVPISHFDLEKAEEKLLKSPLIKNAKVSLSAVGIIVDYTVRQPLFWLSDYENIAMDEEGFLFPVYPFFSPKKLPELYLGAPVFKGWKSPLTGKEIDLALKLVKMLKELSFSDQFHIKRIDLSQAFAGSYGAREIVLITEDEIALKDGTREISCLLRLSTKNFAQELGNYLELRQELLSKEKISKINNVQRIIDFRIPNLAFLEEINK